MSKRKKQFIYVSGPPCGGKSTLSNELINSVEIDKYILGDDSWIANNQDDFTLRSLKTNKDILLYIDTISSDLVLLEWVPSYGSFVENLIDICQSKGYEFIHIVVYAPIAMLKERKLKRDGDKDLGPINIEKLIALENVTLFDTSLDDLKSLVSRFAIILKNNVL